MDLSHDDSPEAELPSCSGCRKRKLKCSRQRPACSNCERLALQQDACSLRTTEKVEKALFGSALEEGTRDSEGTNCHLSADRTSSSSSAPLEAILSTLAERSTHYSRDKGEILPKSNTNPVMEILPINELAKPRWNPGIDSEDVRRRLPICGGSWFHNEPAVTPYFGNWGQPAAQSGHGTSPCYSVGSNAGGAERPASAYSIRASDRTHGDISKIGALAYYIQSIDSLSQISKTFLQPAVDFTNRQEVSLWLTKFKELDLRLVQ
uniref:Zn(2)-C6 fungal-type domain-containing protein n=1 Tax=Fusarium oxysporum (strain Fo5176) TaxID=660025 RepID=A0A0C4DJA2_FUSOF